MAKIKWPSEPDMHFNEIVEIVPDQPVDVPQTNTLYRLAPAADNASHSRQIVTVVAESEAQARALATSHDPFGQDWTKETLFACQIERVAEPNVIGDVIFESIPPIKRPKRRGLRANNK